MSSDKMICVGIMTSTFDSKAVANCPEDREVMVEVYLAGTLSDSEKAAFEAHYFGCSECFRAVQFRQEYKSFIKEEAEEKLPELVDAFSSGKQSTVASAGEQAPNVLEMPSPANQRGSSHGPWLRIAAILVLVGGLAYFWNPGSLVHTPFTVNSGLEEAMNPEVRSGKHLTVYSPQIGEQMDGQISFTWAANDSDVRLPALQLAVMDNEANLIHEAPVQGGSYNLDKELAPGLYYWELATRDSGFEGGKTLFLGKFTVSPPGK